MEYDALRDDDQQLNDEDLIDISFQPRKSYDSPTKPAQKPLSPYEPDITRLYSRLTTIHEQVKSSPQTHQSEIRRADHILQEAKSFITMMQIDQKALPASQKKKDLKNRLVEINARYRQFEQRQAHLKSLIIMEQPEVHHEAEEDQGQFSGEEEDEVLIVKNKGKLDETAKEVARQGQKLEDAKRIGHQTIELAREAMLMLRGQRDQIVNTVGLVRDIGSDLVKSDKIARDINRRQLLTIVVLYLVIIVLFLANCFALYYKLFL
ncbi:hypothetical protein FGO68_gene4352 [Halteria grandinella]|uniref:t-SNARE coiled-coil homology domain-containing protein n=1 Tax=Halteria grandinella TaxID=5974 RepID=A0A8J8NKV5_HALGN|nr:hypothetical protein FGO68_gene4352 [Halteria grandinella]